MGALTRWTRSKHLLIFLAAKMVAMVSVQIYTVLQSWLVLDLTGSTLALGTLLMMTTIPRAVLLPVGGVLADRLHPRNLVIGTGYAFALLLVPVALLLRAGGLTLGHLALVALGMGLVTALYIPASTSILPDLVEAGFLQQANAANHVVLMLSFFLGPALAGGLITAAGTSTTVVVVAGACALCAAAAHLLPRRREAAERTEPSGAFRAFAEGLAVVWTNRVLQGCIALAAVLNLAVPGPLQVGLPALAADRGMDPSGLGLLMASSGLGQIVGAVLGGAFGRNGRQVARIMALGLVAGALWTAIGWIPHAVAVMAVLAGAGLWLGILNVVAATAIQVYAPPHLLGRVLSLQHLGIVGLQPVSFLVSGWVMEPFGTPAVFEASGVVLVLTAVVGTVLMARGHERVEVRSAG
jgi:MFS family permease